MLIIQSMLLRLRQRGSVLGSFQKTAFLTLALTLAACDTTAPQKPVATTPIPLTTTPAVTNNSAELARQAQEARQRAMFQELISEQDRLYQVAAPLLLNNLELCSHRAYLLGFTAKNQYSYTGEFVEDARQILRLSDPLQIMGVMAGSGAAKAGVQNGDQLVAVNETELPQGPSAEAQARAVLVPLIAERTSINLTIKRNGTVLSFKVPLTHACAFTVELGNTEDVNAYADGHRVMLTRGMIKAAASDEELAYILATEMAHNALGHANKQHNAEAVSAIIDNLARIHPDMNAPVALKPSTQELDVAADKRGLYMLARAGYSIDDAGRFWSRLATQYPAGDPNSYNAVHPFTTARLSAITRISNDIRAKQAARKPIMP